MRTILFWFLLCSVSHAQYVLDVPAPGTYYLDLSRGTLSRVTATISASPSPQLPPAVHLMPLPENRAAAELCAVLFRELSQRIMSRAIPDDQIVATAKALAQVAVVRGGGTVEQAQQYASKVEAALAGRSPSEMAAMLNVQAGEAAALPLELVRLVVTLVMNNQQLDLRTLLSILETVWPIIQPILRPDRAVYIYEKDHNNIPREVDAALSELLRSGISVSAIDDDVRNVRGEVPSQFAAALAAADPPCLVVLAGDQVLRVVKAPTTRQQVLDAVGER